MSAGRLPGTSWKIPSRPSCSRLIRSQFSRTRPAVRASASPNTCGWRATSFAWIARATVSRSPSPRSASSSERKYTWKSRSPSSSSSFGASSRSAASATSYASSTVCGTIVRAVCSRSQGQSRRSRSVSCCSSSSAAPSELTRLPRGRGGAGGRLLTGILAGRRRVSGLVGDLRAVVVLQLLLPVLDRLGLLVLKQRLPDRFLDLGERRRLRGRRLLHRPEGLDDVPAELRVHRPRDLVRLERERDALE